MPMITWLGLELGLGLGLGLGLALNPNPSPTPNPIPNPNPNANQYGYDSWMDLTSKKARGEAAEQSADPSSGIMDLMKQMYDEGDDNMKKTLGEAMLKSRQEQMRGGKLGDDL